VPIAVQGCILFWLLQDFDLFSVLLRAASLALEALTVGGTAFLVIVAVPSQIGPETLRGLRTAVSRAALALAVVQVLAIAVSCAILIGGSGFSFLDVTTADFFVWGTLLCASVLALFLLMRASSRKLLAGAPLAALVLLSSLGMSHAASRLDHRGILLVFTAFHHIGTAAWIGAMPFLLMALRREKDTGAATRYVSRFSAMAICSVSLLLLGGIGMSLFYAGSWQGVYGTTYGVMLLAKVYLFLIVVGMGAGNFLIVRQIKRGPAPLQIRLRRFSEAEIGLGFTAILAAASLTSQPPAVDLIHDRLSAHEIVERMRWVQPRLTSPPFQALAPVTTIQVAIQESLFSSGWQDDANDRAWSEYNHHWAGLIVLSAGLLALLARSQHFKWAQCWPLLFIALAVFIVLRADPENWPLGPRSFWASFSSPDVLQHRLYALLIMAFAIFEWAAETDRLKWKAASYVFPILCAAGGALMMTHSHPQANLKDAMLIEMSHTPIALLGVTAGWSRWLELRLPQKRDSKIASYVWPVCLMLVGILLLNYRES
jgi:putative copper resistance protein D